MGNISDPIVCDGCGLPASPDHIAERVARLELATKFRPIHINMLFVALAPMGGMKNDFYGPPAARDFFDAMMDAAEVTTAPEKHPAESSSEIEVQEKDGARLVEFQHRGYYVAFLSECSLPGDDGAEDSAIARLSANLVRRFRFNYKPKQIALFGTGLSPLIEILNQAGLASILQNNNGYRAAIATVGDSASGAVARPAS